MKPNIEVIENDEIHLELFFYPDKIKIGAIVSKHKGAGALYIRKTLIRANREKKDVVLDVSPLEENITSDFLFSYYTSFGFIRTRGNEMIWKRNKTTKP